MNARRPHPRSPSRPLGASLGVPLAWSLLAATLCACAGTPSALGDASGPGTRWPGPTSTALTPTEAEGDRQDVELVRRVMPSIVLVVNTRVDGKTTYGAGFFAAPGLVLTALHVVEDKGSVALMLYRAGRSTYSPMDGGIMRFLFENTRDLVPATIAQRDGVSDLATLAFDPAVLPNPPILPWSADDVRPGERVLALGHPQQTPWSFSAGIVGALQYGLIQHDATVGPGSSGGPLLNTRGEVVGVNVAQVVSQPVGLSFARPAHVVTSAFAGAALPTGRGQPGSTRPSTFLDLGSATSSALSCWRAQELALREVAECFDWESEWRQYVLIVEEAASLVRDPDLKARISQCVTRPGEKEAFVDRRRTGVIRALDPSISKSSEATEIDPADRDLPPAVAALYQEGLAEWRRAPEGSTRLFAEDFRDPERMRSRLRLGLRVEDTRRIAPDLEWVLFASKNSDGTVAHFSELYAKVGEQWLQRAMPWPDEVQRMPKSWPPPMDTFAVKRKISLAYIVKRALRAEGCSARTG